jgi:hypothetical protein
MMSTHLTKRTVYGFYVACLAGLLCWISVVSPAGAGMISSDILLNFNGTAIPADGRYIWFNSVLDPTIPGGATSLTIFVRNANLHVVAGANTFDVPAPDVDITYTTSATGATTVTSFAANKWTTNVPLPSLAGNEFLDGLAYQPSVAMGNANVTWSADFGTDYPGGVSLKWQAAAAVYTTFSADHNALCIKPTDDGQSWYPAGLYNNADKAGTPEGDSYKSYVVGGATGGGGSNYTGSLSPTVTVDAGYVPEPGTLVLLITAALGLLACARRRRRS